MTKLYSHNQDGNNKLYNCLDTTQWYIDCNLNLYNIKKMKTIYFKLIIIFLVLVPSCKEHDQSRENKSDISNVYKSTILYFEDEKSFCESRIEYSEKSEEEKIA